MQLCQVNFLQWEADHLQLKADHLETGGLQQVEFAVARSEAEGLYGLIHGAMSQPDTSLSMCLLPPKRHRQVPSAMALESKTSLRPLGFQA